MFAVDEDRFVELVEAALAEVPAAFVAALDNVAMFVDDDPPGDTLLLGLYEGIPLTERDSMYSATVPDRITVYRRPILAICDTEADVIREVRTTVMHELGHYFGLDDQRLHELGHG